MADPISDLFALLSTNTLCLIGALSFVAFLIVLIVILRIKKIRSEETWAYNPDRTLRLRWRR